MNKKNISKENYFERLRELASVKKPIKESLSNSTLVNFVRASNNVAYAIIKENHNYYIKTSNKQGNDLNVADFAYIGGVENKKEFQYPSLSEADKNRNFVLININETTSKLKTNGTKLVLINEDISNAQSLADKNTAKDSMPKAPSKPKNISVDGLNNAGASSSSTTSDTSNSEESEESSTEEKETTDESFNNALFEGGKKNALSVGSTSKTTKPDPSKDQKKADKNTATDSMPKKLSIPSNIIHNGKINKDTPDPSKDQKKADKNKATDSIPKTPEKPSDAIVVEDISNAQTNANKDNEDNAQKEADKTKSTKAPEKGVEKKIANSILKGKEEKSVFVEKPKKSVNEAEDEKDDIEAAASALDDLDAADAAGKAADAAGKAADAAVDAADSETDAIDASTATDDGTATTGVPTGDSPEGDFSDTNTAATNNADSSSDDNDTNVDAGDNKVDAFGNGSEESEETRERKKYVGKLQNIASTSQLTDSETLADLKQIIAGYKEGIKGLDVDQLQELIGSIKKASDESNDSENSSDENGTNDGNQELENESAFHKHMSECGYDPSNSSNISVMEMAGIINSWANKLDGNDEDGDFETVAKYYSPEVEKEVNESGNGEFSSKIKPFAEKLSEDGLQKFGSFEPQPSSIDELFGDEESEDEISVSDNEDDDLESISNDNDEKKSAFVSPAILSTPTTTTGNVSNGSKTVSVDLKNQMITMNVTEAQVKNYIKKKLEEKKGIKSKSLNESEELSDDELKKEIDALINKELKEDSKTSLDQVTEARLRKIIKFRLEEKFGKRKTNLHESIKNSSLLKIIDKYIDEMYKDYKTGTK